MRSCACFRAPPHGTGSTHSLDLPREELGKPERRASAPEGDNIKIVIDDVDSQGPPPTPLRKRVLLQRDPADTGARTRGFGMRVMGGKKAPDGHLYAAVAWVLAGSSADLAGLKQGDVILEWNGTSLVDRSYEEVCAILDKSPHSVELVVETGRKMSNRELRASTGNIPSRKSSTCSMGGGEGAATRRKLPKTPDEICNKAHVQGELGVRLWYDGTDLEVTVLGARGLPPRRSYVKLRLHEPGSESLEGLFLDLTVWDHRPVGTNAFLGEVQLPLDRAPLRDTPEWLPLSRGAGGAVRSHSQDLPPDDLIRSSSMDSMLLHPDDAWQGNPVERKSSAPSVYSVSTAPNAKNRQLLAQDSLPELYASSPTQTPERAKSASFKVRRNVNLPDTTAMDERRSLPRRKLSRTVSLKSDERVNHVPVNKGSNDGGDSSSGSERCHQEVGPGQKNSRRDLARLGELKLGFIMTKGQLEVEVVCARGLPLGSGGTPPDTYVKTYLKEGDRQMQKRKTRVVRHSCEPQYRQTLKYTAADVLGRSLLVTVWERARGFEHNQPLGAALVHLDRLELSRLTLACRLQGGIWGGDFAAPRAVKRNYAPHLGFVDMGLLAIACQGLLLEALAADQPPHFATTWEAVAEDVDGVHCKQGALMALREEHVAHELAFHSARQSRSNVGRARTLRVPGALLSCPGVLGPRGGGSHLLVVQPATSPTRKTAKVEDHVKKITLHFHREKKDAEGKACAEYHTHLVIVCLHSVVAVARRVRTLGRGKNQGAPGQVSHRRCCTIAPVAVADCWLLLQRCAADSSQLRHKQRQLFRLLGKPLLRGLPLSS
ncbi:hypothetical protein MTO96_010970 [Rhipicephalus appendiculatus]